MRSCAVAATAAYMKSDIFLVGEAVPLFYFIAKRSPKLYKTALLIELMELSC